MPVAGPGGGWNPAQILWQYLLGDHDMAIRGVGITLQYLALNISTGTYVTGDVANHAMRWIKDGVAAAPTNTPVEVDATNAPGAYKVALTNTEMTCDTGMLHGKSSTANVIIIPVQITTEHGVLPTVQQGQNGAVMVSGANVGPWSVVNSAGDAVTFQSTGGNGVGLRVYGNGSGAGAYIAGGLTGHGLYGVGQGGGHGIFGQGGPTSGAGIFALGGGSGAGLSITGGATGHGLICQSSGVNLSGIYVSGSLGVNIQGTGSGAVGINVAIATQGQCVQMTTPSGTAVSIATNNAGHGMQISTGGLGGNALYLNATGAQGTGLNVSGPGATSGTGIKVTGGAAGGVTIVGGAMASGLVISGGATSGNAVTISATSGDGINVTGGGAGNGITATGGATSGNGLVLTGGGTGVAMSAALIQGDLGGRILGNTTTGFVGVGALTSSAGGGPGIQQSWNFDATSTVAADPGKGKYRFNTATPSTATALYLDSLTNTGFDFANYFRTFKTGDYLTVQDSGNAANWVKYTLTAAPVDNSGWWTVAVNSTGAAGVVPNNNSSCDFLWNPVASDIVSANVVQIMGTASAGAPGYVGIDWSKINLPASVQDLSQTTIKNLDNAPPGGGGGGGGPIGPGGSSVTIHAQDLGGNPIPGVYTWVTTDSAGNNKIAGTLPTDTFGNVGFMLQPGSYYSWMQKPNYTLTNPTPITVV
jgi:hypothetical protein